MEKDKQTRKDNKGFNYDEQEGFEIAVRYPNGDPAIIFLPSGKFIWWETRNDKPKRIHKKKPKRNPWNGKT